MQTAKLDSEVWERLIGKCARDTNYIPHLNGLLEERLHDVPEGAKVIARRARRCQDGVRRRLYRVANQCLDEKSRLDLRQSIERDQRDRARLTMGSVYGLCTDQYYDLMERLHECCAVIPGY